MVDRISLIPYSKVIQGCFHGVLTGKTSISQVTPFFFPAFYTAVSFRKDFAIYYFESKFPIGFPTDLP